MAYLFLGILMRWPNVWQITGRSLIALCVVFSPVEAQERALAPLADDIAAQFPAIGRLGQAGFRTQQGCTATLIAPDLIVTAAHCVSDSDRSDRAFVAGWSRGDYIAARAPEREMRHPAYALNGRHGPRNDIALIVLESPIDDVTPIPLGDVEDGRLDGTEAALLGYHRKSPHVLSGSFTCPVRQFGIGLLRVGCPVINGNSGAPLLDRAKHGGWELVGVVSSQLGAGAIAVELPDWLQREVAAHLRRESVSPDARE